MSRTPRTDAARELAALAAQIAARIEQISDLDMRKTAAHTLRTLATTLVTVSESADQLQVQYEQAIALAKNATELADKVLPGRRKGPLS